MVLFWRYEGSFISFYKKSLKYLVLFAKEKREKLETIVDWVRKLIIRKEKQQPPVLSLLEEEYMNIINTIGRWYVWNVGSLQNIDHFI